MALDVDTPIGIEWRWVTPGRIDLIRPEIAKKHELTLLRSDRAMTDCRPVSLLSVHTVRQLGEELGTSLDKRRFRASLYLDLKSGRVFEEDAVVGRALRVGAKTATAVLERNPRCMMITLDPGTGQLNAEVMKQLANAHETNAGVYGAVLIDGTIRRKG